MNVKIIAIDIEACTKIEIEKSIHVTDIHWLICTNI